MECPKCKFKNMPEMHFCGKCGVHFNEETAVKSVSKSERKQVTALFSDITGYTAITGRIDPEDVKEITGRIFQGAAEIVAHYGGIIEGFVGDGMLVLFGIPKSHGDDPVRAIHSAREIHELVVALSPQYEDRVGVKLSMHSGINTGLAVADAADTFMGAHGVTGDVINVASRLSNLAQPHEIIVGFETYRACRNYFSFKPLKQTIIKGKPGQIPIYQLLSTKVSTSFNIRSGRYVASKIVGRARYLDRFEKRIRKTIAGKGSVVNVIGEAGIGKSRLIAELKRQDVMKQVTLLEGQSISIGKNLSFHPVIDLLKQWAMIADSDVDALAFVKLDKIIRKICPQEIDEILPFMATLMGLNFVGRHAERVKGITGESLEKLILKSMRELFIKGSESRPVVVIMEDLHWADASSIRLLESLYRLVEKYRVTFINIFRPAYLDRDTRSLASVKERLSGCYIEEFLQPLNDSDSKILIDNMLESEELSRSVRSGIVQQAGGNPFFIEEVIRSLIDEAAVVRCDNGFEIADKINSIVIPSTINDVLIARLDRLEAQTRELVKVASVIGRDFFDIVIRDVAESIDDVDDRLEHLKEAQLIIARTRMQELEYQFNHALIQETAYGTILIKQRKVLHLRVAKSIEKLFPERLYEFYGILAYHYNQGEDLEKTEEYLIKAGEESLRTSASREALFYFKKALKLFLDKYGAVDDFEKLVVLEKNIALASCQKGLLADGLKYYDRVLERLEAHSSGSRMGTRARFVNDLLVVICRLYFSSRKAKRDPDRREKEIFETTMKRNETLVIADTGRAFSSMIRLLRTSNAFDITKTVNGFRLWVGTGTVFSYMGVSFRVAKKFIERSAEMVDKGKVEDVIAYNNSYAMYKYCAGSWNGMNGYDEDLIDNCLKSGAMFYIVPYSWSVGLLKVEQGNFAEAEIIIDKLFNIAENYDHYQAKLVALGLKSHLLFKSRDFLGAERSADERFSLASELDVTIAQLAALGHKIMIKSMLDDVDAAAGLISRAEDMIAVCGRLPPYCIARYRTGRFINDMSVLRKVTGSGRSADVQMLKKRARQSGGKALENVRKYAPSSTFTYKLMGDYFWLVEKQGKAMKYWSRAIVVGERMGARPDLSRTCFEVGKRMLDPGSRYRKLNGIDANGYLEKAVTLFEEMGLERDLEDLKRFRNT